MTRRLGLAAALALSLVGCDAARGPFVEAGGAEAEGRLDEAIARYANVCSKAPSAPLCARADARSDRLLVKKAVGALAEKRFREAKAWVDTAAGSKDAAAREAAVAVAASPDFVQGLAWLEASALADRRQALPAIEALATLDVTSSADAAAWLEKNRPALLLDDARAACGAHPPEGASCILAKQKLAHLHPRSPEVAAARMLVEGEYQRMFPSLRRSEMILLQAVPIGRANAKLETCLTDMPGGHASSIREICQGQSGMPDSEVVSDVQVAWNKVRGEVTDPEIARVLDARWSDVLASGDYVPRAWPPPMPER